MSRAIQVRVDEHATVLIELVSPTYEGLKEAGAGKLADRATEAFDDILETIRGCAERFSISFQRLDEMIRPAEATVQFGVGLDAEFGIIVTKAATTANFVVTLTWKPDEA